MAGMREALHSWFSAKVDNLNDGLREIAKESAEDGEKLTKQYIETRGTAKSGKQGRIETSAMLNSVSSGVVRETKEEIQTRFGYKNAPYWTAYQDPGFEHVNGVTVEGTYALTDASEEVFEDLRKDIERLVNSV